MTASLTLTYGALNLTASPYLVEFGADLGAPANEAVTLAFLLQDGEVELSSRAGNRTIQFNVLIEGASLTAMATAEAALIAETEKVLNTLTVDPGDGAPASVYEIFRGQVSLLRDDDFELSRLRRYTVTVRALPFPRSATETVTAALPASGSTTTLVNDGSATTGWTGAVSAGSLSGPTVVSGAVKVGTTAAFYDAVVVSATLTASITTSSTKYLVVDWKPESPPADHQTLSAYGDGIQLVRMAEAPSPTAGMTRTWFGPVAASSIAVLRLDLETYTFNGGGSAATIRSLYVDNISRTDVAPSLGTGRQLLRSIAVGGSARTPGSIAIEHSTNALGDVLAYFYSDTSALGYSPSLRQYRQSGPGSATTNSAMVSGATDDLKANPRAYLIPAGRIVPGLHLLMLRVSTTGASGSASITWLMDTEVNGVAVGAFKSDTFTIGRPTSQTLFAVARINLPTNDISPVATNTNIGLSLTANTSTTTTVDLDEAWLFNLDIGQLVGPIACGTGTASSGGPARRMFIEPATVATPRATVRIGHAADRTDSFYPASALGGWQFPKFTPPGVKVLTVTTNATDASVTFRNFNRWHTNAAS